MEEGRRQEDGCLSRPLVDSLLQHGLVEVSATHRKYRVCLWPRRPVGGRERTQQEDCVSHLPLGHLGWELGKGLSGLQNKQLKPELNHLTEGIFNNSQ